MTAGELAVLLAAVLCCIGFTALVVVLMRVLDTLRSLRTEVATLRAETGPLLAEMQQSTRTASAVVAEGSEGYEPGKTYLIRPDAYVMAVGAAACVEALVNI